jgi:hypothetical protein
MNPALAPLVILVQWLAMALASVAHWGWVPSGRQKGQGKPTSLHEECDIDKEIIMPPAGGPDSRHSFKELHYLACGIVD